MLSNIISSQIVIHRKFGGVVPEIASRKHIENILPVIDEALRQANVKLEEIDAVAVTYGPGLVGALLVGVSLPKRWLGLMTSRCWCQSFGGTLFLPIF